LAEYWRAKGDLDEAARHAEHALRLVAGAPSASGPLAVAVAITAAEIARDRAEYDAARDHFAWAVEQAPVSDPLLVRALLGLGDSYRRAARYPQALQTLHRAETLATPDPELLAATLMLLGITGKEMGEFELSAAYYERVRQIHDEAGAALADAASLQHNLAGLAYARGHLQEAEAYARRAVELRHRVPGVATVDIAADRAVLGAVLAAQDRHDEALVELTRALEICRTARPPREYEIAVQTHNLASVHQSSGRLREAEELYLKALASKERLLGPNHPEVAVICNNLGTLVSDQQRAVSYLQRALSIAEQAYPADHPVIAAIRHNLDPR
jgi:tetratricopeptide (TPR) repeat protein